MQQVKSKNPYLGPLIIVGTLIILLLILVAVFGVYILTRQLNSDRAPQASRLIGPNPLTRLDADKIDPALALTSLGGAPEADVMIEAVGKARPETALAILLFQPTLTSKESAGGFLQLATAYANAENRSKAVFSYQLASTVATLAPDIPDTARADIFLQTGEGLIGLSQTRLARFYLDQAFTVASESPYLQAPHRRVIFERLHKNYLRLEDREKARQSLSLSANPPSVTLALENRMVLPDGKAIPVPASLQEAEAERWRAAQQVAILMVERGGQAPPGSIQALQEALLAEDELKSSFYEAEFDQTTQLSKKIDVTVAQINWLSIKYRVARQGYGLSLVPEWELQAEQIRANLTKTYETLYALYADLVVALPEISQIDRATLERLRREVLAGELGRYPNYPQEQRRRQLLDATGRLIETQPEIRIFIDTAELDDVELFTLVALK